MSFAEQLSRTLPSPVKKILRPAGHLYFRVRNNFVVAREYMKYYLFRAKGGTWSDYYRSRRDDSAHKNSGYKTNYLENAQPHFEFLQAEGVQPGDKFLDYGAGYLRLGYYVIPYLETGNYTAADISLESMTLGQSWLEQRKITITTDKIHLVDDCDLKELEHLKFDVIWAQSVLTHMPLENIRVWFNSLRKVMNDEGRVFFTFAHGKQRQVNLKDFYYEPETIKKEALAHGFTWRVCEKWDDGGLSTMICLQ